MRQAGRSLPEYRALRERYSMLAACFEPDVACEITLQPIRRYDVDAAILFSDIVVPLRAAGVDLDIVADVGPVIADPVRTAADVAAMKPLDPQAIQPVLVAASLLVAELGDVPLIGFAGAPFTLASYLVEGGPSRHHAHVKAMMLAEPASWHALMAKLTDLTIAFLVGQIDAGVDAIQVFDSWAGALSPIDPPPVRVAAQRPGVRCAGRAWRADDALRGWGVGPAELLGAMSEAVTAGERPGRGAVVGVDWRTPLTDAAARVVPGTALQGNLDPAVVLAGWPAVERAARAVVDDGRRAVDAGAAGHIFNLGHGVLPESDPAVLADLVSLVHSL
ncbi:Uroporphyrinogen III decarboxylase [Mycobacterium tuberculosis variant bovis BCG str. ATCC 35743]|nr:Uroporphyrinogen III decarboxylase [Mycobacterium tuberculosis variant bovis BCG str. ATCC 35743]